MSEVIISVRGEHETTSAPEIGRVRVSVRTDGADRGEVVERMSALAAPLREDLASRKADGPVQEWSSQRVSVWSDRPWTADGRQLAPVHHASVEITADFTDFMALSWWISEISVREGVQINDVEWRLARETRRRVEAEVAAKAVSVAVDRATAYASALGFSAVEPREVADLGLLGGAESTAPSGGVRMMRASFASADAATTELALEPEPIVVTAAVEARFAAR